MDLTFWLGTLRDVVVNAVPAMIVAAGLTFVIVTREIDISVGSMLGVLATVLGILTSPARLGLPVWCGVVAILVLGAVLGALNGVLVTWGRVPSIIVTLGTLTALQGINALLLHGDAITELPPSLRYLGVGRIAGIPVSIYLTVVVLGVCTLFANRTAIGRSLYALGSNPSAARLAGLSEPRLKLLVFMLTGVLVAIATLASVPQIGVIESNLGRGFELVVITAVLVSGTSINGGRGSIVRAALAAVALEAIRTVLILLRLGESATYWERAIQGTCILVAVFADHLTRTRRSGVEVA